MSENIAQPEVTPVVQSLEPVAPKQKEKKPLSDKKKEALAKAHQKLAESRIAKRLEKEKGDKNQAIQQLEGFFDEWYAKKQQKASVKQEIPVKTDDVQIKTRGRPKKVPPTGGSAPAPASAGTYRPIIKPTPNPKPVTHEDRVSMLYNILRAR